MCILCNNRTIKQIKHYLLKCLTSKGIGVYEEFITIDTRINVSNGKCCHNQRTEWRICP